MSWSGSVALPATPSARPLTPTLTRQIQEGRQQVGNNVDAKGRPDRQVRGQRVQGGGSEVQAVSLVPSGGGREGGSVRDESRATWGRGRQRRLVCTR
jgi:hypothetical protein